MSARNTQIRPCFPPCWVFSCPKQPGHPVTVYREQGRTASPVFRWIQGGQQGRLWPAFSRVGLSPHAACITDWIPATGAISFGVRCVFWTVVWVSKSPGRSELATCQVNININNTALKFSIWLIGLRSVRLYQLLFIKCNQRCLTCISRLCPLHDFNVSCTDLFPTASQSFPNKPNSGV